MSGLFINNLRWNVSILYHRFNVLLFLKSIHVVKHCFLFRIFARLSREKQRFDNIKLTFADFDGALYQLSNPDGDTSRILVSIRLKFFKELQEYGANDVSLLPSSSSPLPLFLIVFFFTSAASAEVRKTSSRPSAARIFRDAGGGFAKLARRHQWIGAQHRFAQKKLLCFRFWNLLRSAGGRRTESKWFANFLLCAINPSFEECA